MKKRIWGSYEEKERKGEREKERERECFVPPRSSSACAPTTRPELATNIKLVSPELITVHAGSVGRRRSGSMVQNSGHQLIALDERVRLHHHTSSGMRL